MTTTFTQQAEEIKKGCENNIKEEFVEAGEIYVEIIGICKNNDLCPECIAKAKALQEAGQNFLEFLDEIFVEGVYDDKDCAYCRDNFNLYNNIDKKIKARIKDIQNGLKILNEVLK